MELQAITYQSKPDQAAEDEGSLSLGQPILRQDDSSLQHGNVNHFLETPETGESQSRHQPTEYEVLKRQKEKMIAKGWCHHHVNHLSRTYDLNTFLYLATLERSPQRLFDHTLCLSHEACIAYNTDTETYETRHVTTDCTCQMVSTPYDRLTKVIRQGGIPLLSIEYDATTGEIPKVNVNRRTWRSKYIAISHVWADGLGNPKANALPVCQIKRLQTRLAALQELLRGPRVGLRLIFFSHHIDYIC
ncbi:hypothetical protein MMC25_005652 [Agyrium rufum]|nr:hypothetical protein [Agyrium rufum]